MRKISVLGFVVPYIRGLAVVFEVGILCTYRAFHLTEYVVTAAPEDEDIPVTCDAGRVPETRSVVAQLHRQPAQTRQIQQPTVAWQRGSEWVIQFNSLWPSDSIWRQRSGSTLAQVMAGCLTAPSHYLNQCWLIISKVEWHSSKGKFTRDTSAINHWNYLEN